jgi:hypothetical protein
MMLAIKPGNQIWLATHNGEVFDEVGRDRIYYVARSAQHGTSVRRATEASEAENLLREMFGYSGYIGVAKSLLFLEGEQASLDRRVFSRLFPEELADVKLVPAGGVDTVTRVNSAVLKVVEHGLGWMTFYALRDRDFLTDEEVARYNSHPTGHLRVLQRCHIENYLLNDDVIAKVMTDIFEKPMTGTEVAASLRDVATKMSADVMTKMVSFRLQRLTWPEDFSIDEYPGVSIFQNTGKVNEGLVRAIRTKQSDVATRIREGFDQRLSDEALSELINLTTDEVKKALSFDDGPTSWRYVFPGKALIAGFAKTKGVESIALQNSVLAAMAGDASTIPDDLKSLMTAISAETPIS